MSDGERIAALEAALEREHKKLALVQEVGRALSSALGILHKQDGVAMRATYIVDPEGVIRFVSVTDMNVGRNVDEVLRVLDALQTDELCPCNWKKGDATLEAA